MAELSINELARMVGVPTERLLEQVREAGLPQRNAEDTISNEQRASLLAFLKSRHGDTSGGDTAPKKITLKKKTVETLRTSDNQGRTKAVNVEVRKKRTYVKRSVEEAQKEAAERERLKAEQEAQEEKERFAREAAARAAKEAEEAKNQAEKERKASQEAKPAAGKPETKQPEDRKSTRL